MTRDEARENALAVLRSLVGNYEEMKPLTAEQELVMCAIAMHDVESGLCGRPLGDGEMDCVMKHLRDVTYVTMLYLYCNWRVWMTYENDEELARKYQSVCDEIDGYIFDNYDKDSINYFVKETD